METEQEQQKPRRRQREKVTFVLCVEESGEWPTLKAEALKKDPACYPVQVLQLARLGEECEVSCGFFLGDGNRGTRRVYFTAPVKVVDYWTPGPDGISGELRAANFLEALGKLCFPQGGTDGGVSIKPGDGVVRVGYG